MNRSDEILKYPFPSASGLQKPPGTMPQLYSGNEPAATGAGCHALAYAFNSAWLPNTIKMQKAAIKQNLFAVRFLKIQPATSKISIQVQGDKKNDTTAEAKGYIRLILVKIREKPTSTSSV